jgi:hypothetical protein
MTLSRLSYDDFIRVPAWQVLRETSDEEDVSLEPATIDNMGLIEKSNGEVWCLCKAIFSNGEEHKASAMCRGDNNEGPLLLTVFNGSEDVALIMPPAPDFVLKSEGPQVFCKKFDKQENEVFPITFKVVPKFQVKPEERSIIIKL